MRLRGESGGLPADIDAQLLGHHGGPGALPLPLGRGGLRQRRLARRLTDPFWYAVVESSEGGQRVPGGGGRLEKKKRGTSIVGDCWPRAKPNTRYGDIPANHHQGKKKGHITGTRLEGRPEGAGTKEVYKFLSFFWTPPREPRETLRLQRRATAIGAPPFSSSLSAARPAGGRF
ncbi:hypothetical protein BDY21DRAFT_341070 [Lineolata rhizophorae]|uniref:Uncharacterized protein n=1 Tax=Lineolata rhizophorae TaxID=578093 RepID=A0A6A6P3U1_9PEZI|nr:hypothetical protein BDY21DRAFT_341070 [Lineolata rhizophorae]